ncbi:branched-chain amino acid ABC transporter permease [Ensifer adhaerens]|jgi:branched-chain amino acid transport system permease protein|uniref:branched-chain amino acid ABC transporter permease n=1 Tax=Ensifer adhaerens TaxID=106592 RepID=UPI00202F00D5|nr:branched-chain amino acid ABC transporter permease [Ensifer adhaerens]
MDILSQIVLGALFQGSLYAIMAVALALVWTTIGVFNFSHGVLMMLGAYAAWQLTALGLPFYAVVPITVVVLAAIGWAVQAVAIQPLLRRSDVVLPAVITTLAVASMLENGALEFWGPRSKQLPPLLEGSVQTALFTMSLHQASIIVLTPVLLGALWFFLNRTRHGLAMRAVAQNEDASLLVGMNVRALYGASFALAAAFAGLAGVLMGGYRFMSPFMGADPMLKAMIVVVFGGLSSITGPIIAAYAIALFEAFSMYFFGMYWTPTILFAVLIVTLMVRPEGILGTRSRGLA